MEVNYSIARWNNIKHLLKLNFPNLTNADLNWRDGNTKEVLWAISLKVGISRKELMNLIENAPSLNNN
ncbi:MAG: hypothetical protein CVU09_14270 [Bacteroidetes bacterium HGW-Bacteroidetes-4]|jgi:hypothetical protein|nr:MAG: hypothetical protein CVU09_14270 [Bacteroidetes bacterium HGW-Bacteroidetes-4]